MFKGPVRVEMADLEDEKESLANFLRKHFKLNPAVKEEGLELRGEEVSTFELQRMVTKFVNSKRLNLTHWVAAEGNAVKIKRFNRERKGKKSKHPVTASTIRHGW